MSEFWSVLGIPPTQDAAQIKSAYARQSKTCNPEEDPQGFMRLREAYQAALAYAQGGEPDAPAFQPPEEGFRQEEREEEEEEQIPQEVTFTFSDGGDQSEVYLESAAYQKFSKLYQKANMKNWKLWMEYFVSPEFLEMRSQEGFCALLMEHVLRLREQVKPGGAFLRALHVTYCIRTIDWDAQGRQTYQSFSCRQPPAFMLQLLHLLPACGQFSGEDLAMFDSFAEYDRLISVQQSGWDDKGLSMLSRILNDHILAYIKDKIPAPSFANPTAADHARHPLSLRLLTSFYAQFPLPAEAYQIAWTTLDLKSAKMGRMDVLYGALRAICLEKCPSLEGCAPQRFTELKAAFSRFWEHPQVDPQIVELFRRTDMESALLNWDFVEHNVLNHWISSRMPTEFLEQLRAFYLEHPQAPFATRIQQQCRLALAGQQSLIRNREDALDDARTAPRSLTHRPFLRYWLQVAFPRFRQLHTLVQDCLPLLPDWRKQLFFPTENEGCAAAPIPIRWEGLSVQVILHQFYLEYRLEDEELAAPCFRFQDLLSLGEVGLWLLPMALVEPGQEEFVEQSIAALLADTAFPPEKLSEAAAALTDGLYLWNQEGDVESVLIFQETELELYGAEIAASDVHENGGLGMTVQLFQLGDGLTTPQYLPDHFGPFFQWEDALSEAHTLLNQLVLPPPVCYAPKSGHHSRPLPECVYYKPHYSPEKRWEPPAALLNRLWETLDQWARLRQSAQGTPARLDAIAQLWRSWTQNSGHTESLIAQMQTLCGFVSESLLPLQLSPQCLTAPQGPLALLDQLQTDLLQRSPAGEAAALQALWDFPGWAEETAPPPPERLPDAVLQKLEPLLDWLWRQVDDLRELYLQELDQLLASFADGSLERLELVVPPQIWELPGREEAYPPVYSLVLQRGKQGLSCLYFDDLHNLFYALHREENRPGTRAELFVNLSQDKPLPACCLFASFFPFQSHLQEILDVLLIHSQQGAVPSAPGDFSWLEAWGGEYRGSLRNKYNVAKRELGGFPLQRAVLPLNHDISLPAFIAVNQNLQKAPSFTLTLLDPEGKPETALTIQQYNRHVFTQAVRRFFAGELSQLCLGWEVDPASYKSCFTSERYQELLERQADQTPLCHILLTRDGPRMMLLVLEDFIASACYHVADQRTYIDVERKYPKADFAGKTVPAYLIHTDPAPLRSQLDLLLSHLSCPYFVTKRFAEYAEEKPSRARAYAVIRAEVLGV